MNLLDLSGPLQAFASANRVSATEGGPQLYEAVVASAQGGMVMTSAGLAIDTRAVGELDGWHIDTLVVSGGYKGEDYGRHPVLKAWIAARTACVRRRYRCDLGNRVTSIDLN
ncbi:MAG: hypothetical protein JOY60_00475 [Burkholderiaceae bacterium]|nr:hypothetical protein [Burkholderiaceae bacterium]